MQGAPVTAAPSTSAHHSCTPAADLPPNHHIIQQQRIEKLQSQLSQQRLRTAEAQTESERLAGEIQQLKDKEKCTMHRSFQVNHVPCQAYTLQPDCLAHCAAVCVCPCECA